MKITGWEKKGSMWFNHQPGTTTSIVIWHLSKKAKKPYQFTVIARYDYIVSPIQQVIHLPDAGFFNIHIKKGHEVMFGKWYGTKEEAENAAIVYMKKHPKGLEPNMALRGIGL
jgi:co-chaperonin GroES (HSP10)